ncbi:MAG: MotA/TolQ/ExbB proton channel family protein [Pseudomonadota bacterium]
MLSGTRRTLVDSEHVLLLKGLVLLAVVSFAFVGAWRYGLLHQVWREDLTGLSVAITLVFLAASAHGSLCLLRLSRALNHLADVQKMVGTEGIGATHTLPDGCVSRYIQDLQTKASLGNGRQIDQGLLLESFEAELKHGHLFGWFIADLLLSLGLLGTVIGFIVMLGPISGLDGGDHSAIKQALAAMSGGMAVALYTTLTGLIGGMLLKIQHFLLDGAVDELIRRTTRLTEVHILPAIERTPAHATI